MAPSTGWSSAFLRCANEDLEAAAKLLKIGQESPGTIAMLFQMSFEKIGKSYLIAHANKRPDELKIHKAATVALRMIKLNTDWLWDGGHRGQQWKTAILMVKTLEEAQPSVAKNMGRNEVLEYPWEDPITRRVLTAAEGIPVVRDLAKSKTVLSPQLIKLGRHLIGKLT